jgi:hypothetical protein
MSSAETGARYFFLSYPRLPPLPPVPGADVADPPDEWVRAFYRDLAAATVSQATAPLLRPGFLDLGTSPASSAASASPAGERRAALAEALSSAAAFVPLLAPEYLRRSWPGREWASFERRAERAGVTDPLQRFVPVLWVPLAPGEQPPGLATALSLAPGAAEPYAENGLRALLRMTRYHGLYHRIVREVAARIVSLAEESPLAPSPATDPEHAESELGKEAKGPAFAVAVAAAGGEAGEASDARDTRLAAYAGLVTERLGFVVMRPEFEKSGEMFRRMPGVVLIDPRGFTDPHTRGELRTTVGELPSWVVPVVGGEDHVSSETTAIRILAEKAYNPGTYRPDTVRRALRGTDSLREFIQLMPFVISHAEREYLRHGPIQRSVSGPAFRPRLAGGRGSAPLPAEENPGV